MAEKTKTSEIERIYTIPLRREWLKEPRSKRSKRARGEVEKFLRKHTKSKEIKLSSGVNELLFSRGFKKPPGKIKVEVKGNFESVQAKLPGEVIEKEGKKKTGIAGLKERFIKTEKEERKEESKKKIEEKAKETTSEGEAKETAEMVKKGEKTEEKKETEGKPKREEKEFKKEKEKK